MTTTRRSQPTPTGTTPIPTPRRFLRCIACGTLKKERGYALCAACYYVNGTLPPAWFGRWVRLAEREGAEYSYRTHPQFAKAVGVYARRRQRMGRLEAVLTGMPKRLGRVVRETVVRDQEEDGYDGLGPYALEDLVAWERDGVELPEPEYPRHRELTDAEIEAWDARVDAWAAARGFSLAPDLSVEIRPWGYAMLVEGALVWTDDP